MHALNIQIIVPNPHPSVLFCFCFHTESQPTLTLWVGTHCGHVTVYDVNTTGEVDLQASGMLQSETYT